MGERRRQSERYAEIGMRLIRTEAAFADIRDSDATICFLSSDAAKTSRGRAVHGQCERVPDKWKWSVPADYAITIFEPNVDGMSEKQIEILLFHELLHVLIDHDKDGGEVYRIRPHDLEDFTSVIERFGVYWDAH